MELLSHLNSHLYCYSVRENVTIHSFSPLKKGIELQTYGIISPLKCGRMANNPCI